VPVLQRGRAAGDVFGSAARGDAGSDGRVDLLMDAPGSLGRQRMRAGRGVAAL